MPSSYSLNATKEWRLNCSVPHEITSASCEKNSGVNTQSGSRRPYFSLSSDLQSSICISSMILVQNMQRHWLQTALGWAGCVCVCVGGVVIKEQCHSSWLLWGDSMTVKVDVAAGNFEVLNDPGVAWLMEWFTWYFSNFRGRAWVESLGMSSF